MNLTSHIALSKNIVGKYITVLEDFSFYPNSRIDVLNKTHQNLAKEREVLTTAMRMHCRREIGVNYPSLPSQFKGLRAIYVYDSSKLGKKGVEAEFQFCRAKAILTTFRTNKDQYELYSLPIALSLSFKLLI